MLIENKETPGGINHLGIEVESSDVVVAETKRFLEAGLTTSIEDGVECCYAKQDKVWVDAPVGTPWEIYTVLEHVEMPAGQLRPVGLTRRWGKARRGRVWYEDRFLPRIGPIALWGLLFTVVILSALQGDTITRQPLDMARIAVPHVAYFAIMWTGSSLCPSGSAAVTRERRARIHRGGQQL